MNSLLKLKNILYISLILASLMSCKTYFRFNKVIINEKYYNNRIKSKKKEIYKSQKLMSLKKCNDCVGKICIRTITNYYENGNERFKLNTKSLIWFDENYFFLNYIEYDSLKSITRKAHFEEKKGSISTIKNNIENITIINNPDSIIKVLEITK